MSKDRLNKNVLVNEEVHTELWILKNKLSKRNRNEVIKTLIEIYKEEKGDINDENII